MGRLGPASAGFPWSRCVFVLRKRLAGGYPPDPRKTSARHKRAARYGLSPEARPEPGRHGCRPRPPRPVPARRCRTARRAAGRRTGSPPPGSGARHPSGTPPPGTVRRVFFAPPMRRRSPGVRGGTPPRQPPQGTHGVWPQGVCGSPEAQITAGYHVSSIGAARSAILAVRSTSDSTAPKQRQYRLKCREVAGVADGSAGSRPSAGGNAGPATRQRCGAGVPRRYRERPQVLPATAFRQRRCASWPLERCSPG